MRIVIDPGHRNNEYDFGACGNGLKESTLSLQIAKKLQDKLIKNGVDAILTRNSEQSTISLSHRCNKANVYNADLFISIHINSAENTQAQGVEVLFFSGFELADDVCTSICKATGAVNRGAKKRNDLYVLNNTKCNAILVECGFISNKDEAMLLATDRYQDKIVNGIFKGLGVDVEVEKIKIKVNGTIKEVESVQINGSNYVKLRDIADSFLHVDYNSINKIIEVECRA